MSMVDPLGDMYTRIRNANSAGKETVDVPASKIKKNIVDVLKKEGFIENFKVLDDSKQNIIRIQLKYGKKRSRIITNIKQVSKPGLRIYVKAGEVKPVLAGMGVAVISTSKGIVTDELCRKERLGGELLCYIW